jgi:hypothetical protein
MTFPPFFGFSPVEKWLTDAEHKGFPHTFPHAGEKYAGFSRAVSFGARKNRICALRTKQAGFRPFSANVFLQKAKKRARRTAGNCALIRAKTEA